MASFLRRLSFAFFSLLAVIGKAMAAGYYSHPVFHTGAWKLAHATFYGDESASETMGGACGYGNLFSNGYGTATAALSTWKAGIVPVMYRRVPCIRSGGVRFNLQGNGYWLLVYVMNVGGGGDIAAVWVKGSRTGWIRMSHNWGASYQAFGTLGGQSLSFKLTSYSSHETIVAYNVVPSNWNVGLTYQAKVNFH
nr:expansin-A7-like [Ipomoea batatas]